MCASEREGERMCGWVCVRESERDRGKERVWVFVSERESERKL